MYVLDTSVISALHRNYFRSRFVTLWKNFDTLVADGGVTSTREVHRELSERSTGADFEWAKLHSSLFVTPTAREASFVAEIYGVPHFQLNIERQKIIKGGLVADAFVIARALGVSGVVVTMEKFKDNSARIPNICKHFDVPCIDLEGFMEQEGWVF
jgi:hypothetical protein